MSKVVIAGRVPDAGRKILYERCAGRYEVAEVLSIWTLPIISCAASRWERRKSRSSAATPV